MLPKDFPISKQDFEDSLARVYNQEKGYLMEENPPIRSWQEWIARDTDYNISLALDSRTELSELYYQYRPEDMTILELYQAYKRGELPDRNNVVIPKWKPSYRLNDGDANGDANDDGKSFPWSPAKIKTMSSKKAKDIFNLAITRIKKDNKAQVAEARKILFTMYHYDKDLAKKIQIPQGDLDKKIRSISGIPKSSLQTEDELNANVPEQYRWNGLTNSSFIMLENTKPEDLDRLVKSVTVNPEARGFYNSANGDLLRKHIMTTFMGIDTKIDYSDLSFTMKNITEIAAKGIYYPDETSIVIDNNEITTVAHEIGHYLDNKWGREIFKRVFKDSSGSGQTQYLSEIAIRGFKGNLDDKTREWLDQFAIFLKGVISRSNISSEYRQRFKEVFARFVDGFIQWLHRKNGSEYYYKVKNIGQTPAIMDRFVESDYFKFIALLQYKGMVDRSSSWYQDAVQAQQEKIKFIKNAK